MLQVITGMPRLLLFMASTEEAFREISLAVELDPVSLGILKDKGIYSLLYRVNTI